MTKLPFLFITLGITSILAQVVLLRELVVTFYGNELFVGLILASWLFWTALGSFIGQKFFKKLVPILSIISFSLPLTLIFIRLIKSIVFLPGEIPNIFAASALTFFVLAPLCFALGSLFTVGTRFWGEIEQKKDSFYPVSLAYLYETLGFALGGLLFNFLLVKFSELRVAFLLAALNLLIASRPCLHKRILGMSFVFLIIAITPLSSKLDYKTARFRFPKLLEQKNSIYGQIAVTKAQDQFNFYESGLLIGTDKDTQASENLVHLALLQHKNPKKVLLIGGGWNGPIFEILKYKGVEKIDYVELDPELVKTALQYLKPNLKKALADSRVKINLLDGRRFVKKAFEKYDVVIINLPNPGTALLNRFYTREFFQEVQRVLNKKGVFALTLSIPTDYLSLEAQNLGASIYKTLKEVFPEVKVLAEYDVMFLAFPQALQGPALQNSAIIERFKEENIKTEYLTEDYLTYRLQSDRNLKIEKLFLKNKVAKINLDFHPTSYFYQTTFWQTYFNFTIPRLMLNLLNLNILWFVGGLILIGLLFRVWSLKKKNRTPILAMFIAGFTIMTLEVLLIFAFQVSLGYIYYKIALLMTLVLVGMALGNFFALSFFKNTRSNLIKIELVVVGFLLISTSLTSTYGAKLSRFTLPEEVFLLLALISGFLVGTIFPAANKLYLANDRQALQKTGVLYGADLFGSFLGALFPSIFLIPILGVSQTLLLLGILNTLTLFLWLKYKSPLLSS